MTMHPLSRPSPAMHRHDLLTLVLAAPLVIPVFIGWMKAKIITRVVQDRLRDCAMIGSPLIVILVVTAGLLWLSVANLDGAPAIRHQETEHAAAVMNLFFRR